MKKIINYKRLALVVGIGLSSLVGCSRKNDALYKEVTSINGKEYLVEVRKNGPGKRLWIYDQSVERVPGKTNEWAGVSFARDDDGDGKIDSLKGPILDQVINIEEDKIKYRKNSTENVYNRLENVIKNSEENN